MQKHRIESRQTGRVLEVATQARLTAPMNLGGTHAGGIAPKGTSSTQQSLLLVVLP
jgi:hypothetical protein